MHKTVVAALALAALGGAACRDAAGVEDRLVTVRFVSTAPRALTPTGEADIAMVAVGENGTLRIDDVRLVVSGVALAGCAAGGGACEPLHGGPFVVDLPFNGAFTEVTTDAVAAGRYEGVVFEVDDPGAVTTDAEAVHDLLAQLRVTYPQAPRDASVLVRGSFLPAGSQSARPFTVYSDVDLSLAVALERGVEVPGAAVLTVGVDPGAWFRTGAGVVDLSALDGRTVDLDATLQQGFTGVTVED